MDPVSITSAALGCVKLIHDLGKGIVALRAAIQGLKEIDNELAAFQGELDALQMALTVLDREIEGSRGKLPEAIAKWWPEASLENILQSAVKTFERLNEIFVDVNKDRRALEKPRQYLSSKFYEDEIRHLRYRLSTYVSCLNLPVILLAIMRQQPTAAPVTDFRLDLLSSKLSALDTSIASLQESFTHFRSLQTSAASSSASQSQIAVPNSQTEATIRDTKVLIDMAESISFNVSTAASRLSTAPSFAWDASSRIDEDLASLFEAALPNRSQNRVLSWIDGQADTTESEAGVQSPPSTAASPDIWTRDGASAAESTTTTSSPRSGINPHQEFRNIKLKRAVDYVNRGETQRAIRVFEELLDQASKSPALPPATDIYGPYARAIMESMAARHPGYITSTITKYPGVESELIGLSVATVRKLLAQGDFREAKPHIMALRDRWSLDATRPVGGRAGLPATQPSPGLQAELDIALARCLLEELKLEGPDPRRVRRRKLSLSAERSSTRIESPGPQVVRPRPIVPPPPTREGLSRVELATIGAEPENMPAINRDKRRPRGFSLR